MKNKTLQKRFWEISIFFILGLLLFPIIVEAENSIDVLKVGLYMEPRTQDPHRIVSPQDMALAELAYEALLEQKGGTTEVEPRLATKWEISDDGLVYTFTLREGVRFHDQSAFNSEAVKFNLERMSALGGGYSWVVKYISKTEIINEHLIKIYLKHPFAAFLSGLTFVKMISPKAVREHEQKEGDYAEAWINRNAVGTGPYDLIEWVGNRHLKFQKYQDYWNGWDRKHVTEILALVIGEAATQRLMLERGDLDISQVFTVEAFEEIKKTQNNSIKALEHPSSISMRVRFNMVAGPTSDIRVRKALSYSFDRKTYNMLMGGYTPWSDGPVDSNLLEGWTPKGLIQEYSLEKAKKLLKEAGYKKDLKLNILYNEGDLQKKTIAEVLENSLRQIGVKLEIKVLTWPSLVNILKTWGNTRDPDTAQNMYCQLVSLRIPDAWSPLYFEYYSPGALRYNMMYYKNDKVDALIDQAMIETDETKRLEIQKKTCQIIVDDVPDINIDKIVDRILIRNVVKGFYFNQAKLRTIPYINISKSAP